MISSQETKTRGLLGESEEELAPTLSKNQKRQLRRIGNKARKKGDDSLLMMGGGGSGEMVLDIS